MQRLIEAGLTAAFIAIAVPAYANPATTTTPATPSSTSTVQPVIQPVAAPSPTPTIEAKQVTVPRNADTPTPVRLSERDRLILENRQQRLIPAVD